MQGVKHMNTNKLKISFYRRIFAFKSKKVQVSRYKTTNKNKNLRGKIKIRSLMTPVLKRIKNNVSKKL